MRVIVYLSNLCLCSVCVCFTTVFLSLMYNKHNNKAYHQSYHLTMSINTLNMYIITLCLILCFLVYVPPLIYIILYMDFVCFYCMVIVIVIVIVIFIVIFIAILTYSLSLLLYSTDYISTPFGIKIICCKNKYMQYFLWSYDSDTIFTKSVYLAHIGFNCNM